MIDEPLEPEDDEIEGAAVVEPDVDEARLKLETEARRYGWKSKEESPTDLKYWTDAENFLQSPRTRVKILEENLKEKDQRLERVEAATRAALDAVKLQVQQKYEAELQGLRAQQRAAVETADTETFDALAQREAQLRAPAEPAQQQYHPDVVNYFQSEKGRWTHNPELYRFGALAIENNPAIKALPPAKQVEWAEKQVREVFPEHFPAQTQARQRVDAGGLAGGMKRGKQLSDLPREAQEAFRTFKEQGVPVVEADFVKKYLEQ